MPDFTFTFFILLLKHTLYTVCIHWIMPHYTAVLFIWVLEETLLHCTWCVHIGLCLMTLLFFAHCLHTLDYASLHCHIFILLPQYTLYSVCIHLIMPNYMTTSFILPQHTLWGPWWQSGNTLASHLCGRGSIPVMAVSGKAGSCLPLVGSLQYRTLANYIYWFPLPFQLPVMI